MMQTPEELYQIIQTEFERGNYIISDHAFERMLERKINSFEIREAVLSGRVLQAREELDQFENKSALETVVLVSGITKDARMLHVCVALRQLKKRLVVTVYEPDLDYWQMGFTIRRRS